MYIQVIRDIIKITDYRKRVSEIERAGLRTKWPRGNMLAIAN